MTQSRTNYSKSIKVPKSLSFKVIPFILKSNSSLFTNLCFPGEKMMSTLLESILDKVVQRGKDDSDL